MMATEYAVEVKGLSFSYGEGTVLEDIHLTLLKGEFLGLVGPNGSGKSTLIRCILGLEQPNDGTIRLFGESVSEFRAHSRIGYVSQKANRFNAGFPATVFEIVSTGLYGKMGLFKRMTKQHKAMVDEMIARVGLAHVRDQLIGTLSGGQQQRVFIARALVCHPDLLILDEPTVGVDAESVERFYALLSSLRHEYELTIILVSHDIGAMSAQVSQVACLNKRLHYHGSPEEFRANQRAILTRTYGHEVHLLEHGH